MKRAWEVVHLAFVGLLVGVGFFALARIWSVAALADHSGKSFWDVATAIGTCGAVLVALHISIADTRRRSREQMTLAKITAAGCSLRMATAWAAVDQALKEVNSAILQDQKASPAEISLIKADLEALPTCSNEELMALAPLPDFCAHHIAGAADHIRGAIHMLTLATTRPGRQAALKGAQIALTDARRFLDHVIEVFGPISATLDPVTSNNRERP